MYFYFYFKTENTEKNHKKKTKQTNIDRARDYITIKTLKNKYVYSCVFVFCTKLYPM